MINLPNIIALAQPYEPPVRTDPEERVPCRVRVAMALVQHFTGKTATQALPMKTYDDGLGYEPLKGQELIVEEREAQASALRLLTAYFAGDMRESDMEAAERKRAEKERKDGKDEGLAVVVECPQCHGGRMKSDCFVCRGRGRISAGLAP